LLSATDPVSAKIPAAAVLRTQTLSETKGFLKALVSTESDAIFAHPTMAEGLGVSVPLGCGPIDGRRQRAQGPHKEHSYFRRGGVRG